MSEISDSQISYKGLLEKHGRVIIPMIQRDYAQGRPDEKEVRENFLNAIKEALEKPADASTAPLNLDFIYGSIEEDDENSFMPLDGQQRLTTLFLLHWYLSWKDQQSDDFYDIFHYAGKSRFSYNVRPSSIEFFDALVSFRPDKRPEHIESLSAFVTDQSWYFWSWRLDPTIQSSLLMLDAIHWHFALTDGLFERLISETNPAITFQLLDLDNFGLSDDLYIKMNARGVPLTNFETFKARYEQELKKIEGSIQSEVFKIGEATFSVAEFVSRRMDTAWADMFWAYRNKSSNLYDDAAMNLFCSIVLITRDPESDSYQADIEFLRKIPGIATYTDFHDRGWLDAVFTLMHIRLFESWSGGEDGIVTHLPINFAHFNEKNLFLDLISKGAKIPYEDAIVLAGYGLFIQKHHENLKQEEFKEWMRIVINLSVNTDYFRPSDMQRSVRGLKHIESHSEDILNHFAITEKPIGGFNEKQVREEKIKAELILAHDDWRELIDLAEAHKYFKGQIEFLLDFSGVIEKREEQPVKDWEDMDHKSLQQQFKNCWEKATLTFSDNGLKSTGNCLWQRALLRLGDYLLPSSRNHSFLVDASTHPSSWKRLLRGAGSTASKARKLLHSLWRSVRLESGESIEKQLEGIIEGVADAEPWRELFIKNPDLINYCERTFIRWGSEGQIYLLKKSQMNGTHAELFTYSLYLELEKEMDKFNFFGLIQYKEVVGTYEEPCIEMSINHDDSSANLNIYSTMDGYKLSIETRELSDKPELTSKLSSFGFQEIDMYLTIAFDRAEIKNKLYELDKSFTVHSSTPG